MSNQLERYNLKPGDQVLVKGWPPSNVLEVIRHQRPGVCHAANTGRSYVEGLPVTQVALVG
jgi:hypothetical protein